MTTNLSRRKFLTLGAFGAAGAAGAAALGVAGYNPTPAFAADKETVETINSSGIVVDPAAVTETISTQILIVGGGLAGMACAVQAAQNGDEVIVLEAQPTLGGNGQGVEGTFAVDSKFQKEQGISIDKSIIMQEELGKTQWCADGLLYKDLIKASAENIEWLVDECGCELEGLIDNYPFGASGGKVDSFHWWKDGAAYVGYVGPMQKLMRELGVDIRLNNRGLEFSYDDEGKVNGVYAMDAFDDLVKYEAQAVVIATGGFADDDKRLIKMGFNLDNLERIGTPGHFGDGVNMTLAAGAAEFNGVCYLKYNRISHQVEMFGPLWAALAFGGPFLWVNEEDCERFVDENIVFTVGNAITQSTPLMNHGCSCLSVFDQKILDAQIEANRENEAEFNADIAAQWKEIIETEDDGWTGNTIAELAENAGVDPQALQTAVDEYNAACAAGIDEWFGKDPDMLVAIDTPPYYLAKIHTSIEGPLGGVKTNRKFQPLMESGGVLDNVYVIGLDGIMLYRDVYPIDVPGSASAECINGGRVAANEAHKAIAG